MGSRLSLQTLLQNLIGVRSDGKANVYFQPPESVKMNYPCIIYGRNDSSEIRANNKMYGFTNGYLVTVIDTNPDSVILDKLICLPMCSFDRHYTADNLNHDVYKLYY